VTEALFREVNEQIRSLEEEPGNGDETLTVICECGDASCTDRVVLSVAEYEGIRDDSLHYVIVSGHEWPGVERVVERHEGWEVVRKVGAAGEVAEETDPRN
jgi:hypothetical protein